MYKERFKMNHDAKTCEQRIQRLERQVKGARLTGMAVLILALVAMAVGLTGAQSVPDLVQAKRFDVVNDNGQVLVSMQTGKHGGMILTKSREDQLQCKIAANGRSDGTMAVFSHDKKRGLVLITGDENGGMVSVMAREGFFVSGMATDRNGRGIVSVTDVGGEPQIFGLGY